MERLIAFNQEGALTDYCNTFQRLFDQVRNYEEISEFYGIYLFICGLEPEIREIFVDWHQYSCIKVKDVISLALKIDSNGLQDSFSPFDSDSVFYKKELEFDFRISLDEIMKDNEFFKKGKIPELGDDNVQELFDDDDDESRSDLEGIHYKTESSSQLCCNHNNSVGSVDKIEVNSSMIISAHRVFDEMPDRNLVDINTQYSDISICEAILSEVPAKNSVIQVIHDYRNDITRTMNHDVFVETDVSSNVAFRYITAEFGGLIKVSHSEVMDFHSFGDIFCCVNNFWGQKSLNEGVLGERMDSGSFGWKPGWLHSVSNVRSITLLKNGKNLSNNKSLDCQGNSRSINSFGWKPGWNDIKNEETSGVSFDDWLDVGTKGAKEWVRHLGEKPEKGHYIGQWKHGRTYGCDVDTSDLHSDIEFTLDVLPIIPTKFSVLSSFGSLDSVGSFLHVSWSYMSRTSPSCITKLTLEGRSDFSDFDLWSISDICVSLTCLNLKGCISVSDIRISSLIHKCLKLNSIVACDTFFGEQPILALCSSNTCSDHVAAEHSGKNIPWGSNLQKLCMGGCKGVTMVTFSKLMSQAYMLKHQFLRETQVVDGGFFSFYGSLLEVLDAFNSKVSVAALAYIIGRNPYLKCKIVRGCCSFLQKDGKPDGDAISSRSIYMDQETEVPKRLKLSDITLATKGFDQNRIIGEGASSVVYEANLPSCGNVAVKRFRKVNQSGSFGNQFATELATMVGCLHHKNLVQLHGWCCEGNELVLVYEYMPNGSLDRILHKRTNVNRLLTFEKRLNILLGVSSALVHLHEECERQIIHRDVKTCNIMLDADFIAKLGDFGYNIVITGLPAGTMGYLAPEYVSSGVPSVKTDVYSFGVVVLEVASGQRPVNEDGVVVTDWVWDLWEKKILIAAADPNLMGRFDKVDMGWMLLAGLICVHPNHQLRPTIRRQDVINEVDCLEKSGKICFMLTHVSRLKSFLIGTRGRSTFQTQITSTKHYKVLLLGYGILSFQRVSLPIPKPGCYIWEMALE